MADAISVSRPVSGTTSSGDGAKVLTFETGKFAPQSQGSVVVKMGDTAVLVTANLLATAVRFVLLRGWVFHPRRNR